MIESKVLVGSLITNSLIQFRKFESSESRIKIFGFHLVVGVGVNAVSTIQALASLLLFMQSL